MVATNLKRETLSLMEKRASMEAEMNAIIAQLSVTGGPGISGNLVDAEGFPRSDIDIPVARAQRARLAQYLPCNSSLYMNIHFHVLRNDHKDITGRIDNNLQVLHSAKLSRSEPQAPPELDPFTSVRGITSQASSMIVDPFVRLPFAMIDEISDDSPAAEDGLQLGDQIIKFGNVEIGDSLIARLASEAQSNKDHPVPLMIVRQGTRMNFTVTPRQWHGRGLLGCHFRIL